MVVRGLGCPVRFTLTAGQKGDAPQAAALIEGLPAEVVIADTAYDADHLRKDIAARNLSRGFNYLNESVVRVSSAGTARLRPPYPNLEVRPWRSDYEAKFA